MNNENNIAANSEIVYFVSGEEKSILVNVRFVTQAEGECHKHIRRNRRFSLVANDTFHNKGEKHVYCSRSNAECAWADFSITL